jgi:uroporphyrinogen decarboxylase
MPVIHWKEWDETRERWIKEGMPTDVNEHKYFNAVPMWTGVWVNLNLFPSFEEEIIEETDEYRIFRDKGGVVQKDWKNMGCIPHFIDFTLKEAKDWPEYKKRLQLDPARIPKNIKAQIAGAEASGLPIRVNIASMMGWIRNWMGVVNMSYLMYDHQDVYADMVDTLAELSCWGIEQVVPKMKQKPDMGFGWEDICGKNGPLVSPDIFRKCVAPGYRKIRNKLEEYGINLLGIDTDGFVEPLLKDWLEAGVNIQFPIEIGTWKADPMELRKKYGKDLHIIGGFNKLELEKGPAAIDAEIERRIPLMKEGGYIIMPDHLITPGTSLENYKYYLEKIRKLRL